MDTSDEAPRRRGRPRSGKKGYFVRMYPDIHDDLVKMAIEDQTDLNGLLYQFTSNWKARREFAQSLARKDGEPVIELHGAMYDAKRALEFIQAFIDLIWARKHAKEAWLEIVRMVKALSKSSSGG